MATTRIEKKERSEHKRQTKERKVQQSSTTYSSSSLETGEASFCLEVSLGQINGWGLVNISTRPEASASLSLSSISYNQTSTISHFNSCKSNIMRSMAALLESPSSAASLSTMHRRLPALSQECGQYGQTASPRWVRNWGKGHENSEGAASCGERRIP